jgi:hypothetical protein
MPRGFDEADLFYEDRVGRPALRSGEGSARWRTAESFMAELSGEAIGEDAAEPARTSVMNPGLMSWVVMIDSIPAKPKTSPWAGAIRQRTDYSSDYEGWERQAQALKIDNVSTGTTFDLIIAANVKGRLKGTSDAVYVMEATVTALEPRDFRPLRKRVGVVDAVVGFDVLDQTQRVRASWDYERRCARVDIPVRVTFHAFQGPPTDFTIVWFGNGDPPITPFTPAP